ncbi:hypothetical protein AB0D83_20620 [Streptomyces decoyicus]|uniref:hypothetical protein n=1 Tax=Streptomyces decoyicus TaxID=249567 RepID=UPI003407AFDF
MPQQICTGTVCVAVHSSDAVVPAGLVSSLGHAHRVADRPDTRFLVTGRHRRADVSAAIDRGANGYG